MEHEKRPRSVDTEEDDSASKAQLLLGPKDDQSEPEADLSGSECDLLESQDDSGSDEERSDKDGSRGTGTGNRNGGVSSSGDGSGNSIGIGGWNSSESNGTCGRSGISLTRGGNASGSGNGRCARDLIIHGPAHRGANAAAMPTNEDDQDDHFFFNHPERRGYFAAKVRAALLPCLDKTVKRKRKKNLKTGRS